MAYRDLVRDTGNQVKVGPNTKGTGTRGVPSAMSQINRTKLVAPVEDPQGAGTSNGRNAKPLNDLGKRKTNVSTKGHGVKSGI